MSNFAQSLDLKTILAFLTPALTIAAWMLDRFGTFSKIAKKPLSLSGEWQGWSIYRPVNLAKPSTHSDPETYFKIRIKIKQRFRRITLDETITDIYGTDGTRLPDIASREFTGFGSVIGGINAGFVLDEKAGLTCGTMFLTLDTWGKQLTGLGIIRNVDGRPVVVEVALVRAPSSPPEIGQLMIAAKTEPQDQRDILV